MGYGYRFGLHIQGRKQDWLYNDPQKSIVFHMYLRPDGKKSVLAAIWQHLTARSGQYLTGRSIRDAREIKYFCSLCCSTSATPSPPLLVYADTSTEVNAVHNAGGRFTLVPPLDPLRRRHLLIFETFRELDGLFVSLLTLLVVLVLSMDRRDNEQPPKSSLPVSLQPLLLSSTTRNSSTRTTIVPEAADDDEQEQDRPPSPLSLPLSTRSAMTSPLYQLDRRRASQPYEGYDPLPPQSLLPELDPGVRHRIPGTSSIHHGSMRPDYHPRAAPNPNYLPPQGEPHYAPQWREGETSTPSWPYPADPPRSSLQQQHPGYLGHAGPSRSYDNLYEQIPPVMSHSREPIDRRSYLPPAPMPSTSQRTSFFIKRSFHFATLLIHRAYLQREISSTRRSRHTRKTRWLIWSHTRRTTNVYAEGRISSEGGADHVYPQRRPDGVPERRTGHVSKTACFDTSSQSSSSCELVSSRTTT